MFFFAENWRIIGDFWLDALSCNRNQFRASRTFRRIQYFTIRHLLLLFLDNSFAIYTFTLGFEISRSTTPASLCYFWWQQRHLCHDWHSYFELYKLDAKRSKWTFEYWSYPKPCTWRKLTMQFYWSVPSTYACMLARLGNVWELLETSFCFAACAKLHVPYTWCVGISPESEATKERRKFEKKRESKLEYRPEIFRPELYCDRGRKIHNGSHPQNPQE